MIPRSDTPAALLHELLVAREIGDQPCHGPASLLRLSQRPRDEVPDTDTANASAMHVEPQQQQQQQPPPSNKSGRFVPRTFVRLPQQPGGVGQRPVHPQYPQARHAASTAPTLHATASSMQERMAAVINARLVASIAATAKRLSKVDLVNNMPVSTLASSSSSSSSQPIPPMASPLTIPMATATIGQSTAAAHHSTIAPGAALHLWTCPYLQTPMLPKSVSFVCEPKRDDLVVVHDGPVLALFQAQGWVSVFTTLG